VLRAFRKSGIDSIVLTGAPLVRRLYDSGERRGYVDCDLLVPPGAFAAACEVLAECGFEPEFDETTMPAWWREHGLEWARASRCSWRCTRRSTAGLGAAAGPGCWPRICGARSGFSLASRAQRASGGLRAETPSNAVIKGRASICRSCGCEPIACTLG
jgi:hypothetical protein